MTLKDFLETAIGVVVVIFAIAFEVLFGDSLRKNRVFRECTKSRKRR